MDTALKSRMHTTFHRARKQGNLPGTTAHNEHTHQKIHTSLTCSKLSPLSTFPSSSTPATDTSNSEASKRTAGASWASTRRRIDWAAGIPCAERIFLGVAWSEGGAVGCLWHGLNRKEFIG